MIIGMSSLALTAASLGVSGSPDATATPEVEALRARVVALESQIGVLTGRPQGGWLTQDEEAMRALVQDVLSETEGRASFRQDGILAGHDGKFFLASPDGNFRLNIEGQMQFRYVYNQLDDQDGTGTDGSRGSFEMRRTKLKFSGNAFDPTINFVIQGAFERAGGAFVLEDAEISKEYDNGWTARIGQFKGPFMREELVSSKRQLAVDRSLVNEAFNQDRSQGIEVGYEGDTVRVAFMFGDGFNTDNTSALAADTEYAFTGRLEAMLAGESWKQFRDFTSWQNDEFGLLVGVAGHVEEGEHGTMASEDQFFSWTADASAEFGGANLFAAVVGRHFDEADLDQYGFVGQGGVFIADELELFGRYEWGDLDMMGAEDLNLVTVGFNKYVHKHALKWTTDFGYAFDEVASAWASSGAGWRADDAGGDGQWVVRSQVQLTF